MKLEDQVCSLELAKRLKELGVNKTSCFDWVPSVNGWFVRFYEEHRHGTYHAFTVAELGEMLDVGGYEKGHSVAFTHQLGNGSWRRQKENLRYVCFINTWGHEQVVINEQGIEERPDKIEFFAATEADARSKMLIYLIENNLVIISDPTS